MHSVPQHRRPEPQQEVAHGHSPGAGFELTGAVGEDLVRLLAEAFRRRKLPVQVKVLINDAPGVMAAGRYMNPSTMIGVILGTGAAHATQLPRGQMVVWQLMIYIPGCLLSVTVPHSVLA